MTTELVWEFDPDVRQWRSEFQQRFGEQPNIDDPQYNYRAAIAAGIRPERYAPDGNSYHWPSSTQQPPRMPQMLKSADHPTAWMEHYMQQNGVDPNEDDPAKVLQYRLQEPIKLREPGQ